MRNAGPPLLTRKLRDLDHLRAASGLVSSGGELYVIADDELQLARFPAAGDAPGTLLRLLPGELSEGAGQRKREKPDFEILMRLPALPRYPQGALLALGSGSRPNRQRGALVALDAEGRVAGEAAPVDAAPLFQRLGSLTGGLNLEGGWMHGATLRLLQRGHRDAGNLIFDVAFGALAAALTNEGVLADVVPQRVQDMELGAIDGVRLTFTDGCGLPDGSWLFSAVAEDTVDAYADGAFAGATLGLVDREGRLAWQRMLAPGGKVEGVHGETTDAGLRILCVTDADDRLTPAQLLEARC